jgi:hypothetical protein
MSASKLRHAVIGIQGVGGTLRQPDFLCIGAQKAGTTWLYHALRQHPQVAMPPIKELHYFDRGKRPYALDLLSKHAPTRRRFLRWFRDGLHSSRAGWQEAFWNIRFFCLPRSDRWYAALFPHRAGLIAGDITPGYAPMGHDKVAHVQRLLPDAKIIYLLRDPIDRAWSQAAMYFRQYHASASIAAVDLQTIRRFILDPYNLRFGHYHQALQVWQTFFPQDKILVICHDEIDQDPGGSLGQICAFLAIDSSHSVVPQNISERIYTQPYPAIPADLAAELAGHFYPSLLRLHEQVDTPHTRRWLERAQALGMDDRW